MEGIEDVLRPICTGFLGLDNIVQILPRSWRDAVAKSLDSIARIMHRLVPISIEMESVWVKDYGSTLVIDIESCEIYEKLPIDLKWFVDREKKLIDDKRFWIFEFIFICIYITLHIFIFLII